MEYEVHWNTEYVMYWISLQCLLVQINLVSLFGMCRLFSSFRFLASHSVSEFHGFLVFFLAHCLAQLPGIVDDLKEETELEPLGRTPPRRRRNRRRRDETRRGETEVTKEPLFFCDVFKCFPGMFFALFCPFSFCFLLLLLLLLVLFASAFASAFGFCICFCCLLLLFAFPSAFAFAFCFCLCFCFC